MANAEKLNRKVTTNFYDRISSRYNQELTIPENAIVRNEVSEYFLSIKGINTVLDFGGGTGLDLAWLVPAGHKVIFCEPSMGMASKALELIRRNGWESQVATVVGEHADLNDLIDREMKPDVILANFSVFNSIASLIPLFSKLKLLLPCGGHLLFVLSKKMGRKPRKRFFRNPLLVLGLGSWEDIVYDGGVSMQVFYHESNLVYAGAFLNGFRILKVKALSNPGFQLYHLIRR